MVEQYDTATAAITREKELKGWLRARKIALIEQKTQRFKPRLGPKLHDACHAKPLTNFTGIYLPPAPSL
jgi:hypothetical protein